MKKKYLLSSLAIFVLILMISSCASDSDDYVPIQPVSPVVVDLTQVPYANLSDYKFFEGEMKNQLPAKGVLPYKVISELFTDYALKKRFVWMPVGVKATYNSDGEVLSFPTGAVLIKSFYYNNVQPGNGTKIIETRLMIKKESGWIFAEYVWNEQQTEAVLQMNGSFTPISWIDGNGINQSTSYRIPSDVECLICHKTVQNPIPIGPKPQNLNSDYLYTDGTKNQLAKWIEEGYLDASNIPSQITTVVDYKDVTKSLDLRVRSYVDINCAHCHRFNSHCDYRSMRFAFNESHLSENMGICIPPDENINSILTYIVSPNNKVKSVMYYRMNTADEAIRMPIVGRTMIHKEGVSLVEQWIGSLTPCN